MLLVGMGVVTAAWVELEWLALALELKWLEYCWSSPSEAARAPVVRARTARVGSVKRIFNIG